MTIQLFTIGFTQRSAESFFKTLHAAGVRHLMDIRLNNTSQMAGFTKRDDLRYFVGALVGARYSHVPELAPSAEILDAYRSDRDWTRYERDFLALMKAREVSANPERALFDGACLLCSEPTPAQCHRRLVAEHLRDAWGDLVITHL